MPLAFFTAPRFHLTSDLQTHFYSRSISANSVFVPVNEIPDDDDDHSIYYIEANQQPTSFDSRDFEVFSEGRRGKWLTLEQVLTSSKPIHVSKLINNFSEELEAFNIPDDYLLYPFYPSNNPQWPAIIQLIKLAFLLQVKYDVLLGLALAS